VTLEQFLKPQTTPGIPPTYLVNILYPPAQDETSGCLGELWGWYLISNFSEILKETKYSGLGMEWGIELDSILEEGGQKNSRSITQCWNLKKKSSNLHSLS
jgi:hypothetical protein